MSVVAQGMLASLIAGLATGVGALPALFFCKVPDKLMRIMLGGKLNEAASLPSAESLQ